MPELPEVETIRRALEPQLRGAAIEEVRVLHPGVIARPDAEVFAARLRGQTIREIARRGKYFIFRLGGGDRLILHLRMTGGLLITPEDYPMEKHTHVVFCLADGRELRFTDLRRFGRFWLFAAGEEDKSSGLAGLGPEPFDPKIDARYLQAKLCKSRRAIKECLLDQSVIAGIGNIYSDEILFAARIHPARPACELQQEEWQRLARCIPEVMGYFLEKNLVTPEEYWQDRDKDYRNTPYLRVYGRAGLPCTACQSTLMRTRIGGRSSVYCPLCQSTEQDGRS